MEKIHFDEDKIKEYAKIQTNLCNLEPNSSDEALDDLINEIPPNYLTQKEELMMICQLFAQYARNYIRIVRGNAIRLFERILTPIKTYIPDEPVFFWKIFGGLFYFKLWFYHEGIITIEEILASCIKDDSPLAVEYFLPEIKEKAPEIFEKEIKFHITSQYSDEYISNFRELRRKHIKWVRESGDCRDPLYREIETNKLRFCLKTDDVDTFQKILSNSEKSINTNIRESVLENFQVYSSEFSLIKFAIFFNSMNIIKFLLMNNVELGNDVDFIAILSHDTEIIHLIESRMIDQFNEFSLINSITCWNNDMIEYSLQNYDFDFLEKSDIGEEYDSKVLRIFNQTVMSKNFVFFESIFLPFLKRNPSIVDRLIHDFVMKTFDDLSCFFTKAFFQYPGIDINHHFSKNDNHTFLSKSILHRNLMASEIILKNENLLINDLTFYGHTAFQIACIAFPNVKILKLLSETKGFDINFRCQQGLTVLDFCSVGSNFLAIDFITNNFDNCDMKSANLMFLKLISNNSLYSLKILLKYYIKTSKLKGKDIVMIFKFQLMSFSEFKDEFIVTLKNLISEITGAKHAEEE